MSTKGVKVKRVESAANNMSALIDDMVKVAHKNFKATGNPELDAKLLKESVCALRELYGLLDDCGNDGASVEGVVIRLEKQIEQWSG